MLVTQDKALYEKVLSLSNHGRVREQNKQFWPDRLGYKYKMSNIQAAIGCAQMERINELIARKRTFPIYAEKLNSLPLKMNPEPPRTKNGYWMPTIVIDKEVSFDREALLALFKLNNIDGRVFLATFHASNVQKKPKNKVSYSLYKRAINLPSYHDLKEEEIEKVVKVIRSMLSSQRKSI